jgi:hypothetical protein
MKIKVERPKDDHTPDGRRIVYSIWRDDLAEATILPINRAASAPDTARPR